MHLHDESKDSIHIVGSEASPETTCTKSLVSVINDDLSSIIIPAWEAQTFFSWRFLWRKEVTLGVWDGIEGPDILLVEV